ncbi:hypothetical protein IFR04_005092 [Cadophora malorum]|uniref:Uncharacterized protein n=1 Tax=Cadophora malorum TaxID=108018 RepID=A0A8H7TMK3_9HELO|nr:hypothetical protein IFR04_005092 [Cadophora malorum]
MASQQRSSADRVIENIFRWPMEGWKNKQIKHLMFAHDLHYRRHHTKAELLTKLVRWAQDSRSDVPSTDRIKRKVRRAYDESVAAGYNPVPTHSFSRSYLYQEMVYSQGSFRASSCKYEEHDYSF